ncbi:hypothetical protein PYW07_000394 [Mythimna separata]|uniref:BPTI/Kunitz inhibitor domain-containing protein n=1 Tax=Mythimna separata TaxID=271217 RepID=A0AAD8E0D8_MYTSE|nr:hypothetical protein PYW07_000394 [Mythimna separata]
MNSKLHKLVYILILLYVSINYYTTIKAQEYNTKNICVASDETIRAKRKKCLLRPDTGPCRADILSYYYDGRQQKCYQFFYGGCQGNGNNFRTRKECHDECFLSHGMDSFHRPYFCGLAFDYGTCFGQYNRWAWDPKYEICKQRLYSGCGGNQNNFETKTECMATCLDKPNNTMNAPHLLLTTCIPFTLPEFN